MTRITPDDPDGEGPTVIARDGTDYERYGNVTLENGNVLLYDPEDLESWIKSDVAIPIEDVA